MALSSTMVGTTLIEPSQTRTAHDTNTRVKLTIVTFLYINERLAIANLSYMYRFLVCVRLCFGVPIIASKTSL